MSRFDRRIVMASLVFAFTAGAGGALGQDYPNGLIGAKVSTRWSDDRTRCRITVEIHNLKETDLFPEPETTAGSRYLGLPRILNAAITASAGKPELPYVVVNLPVPGEADCSLGVGEARLVGEWGKKDIVPVRDPWPEVPGAPRPPLRPDMDVYGKNAFYPGMIGGTLGPRTQFRGTTNQAIYFYPIQYNPRLRLLRTYMIDATLLLSFGRATTPAAGWRRLEETKVLNYSSAFAGSYLSALEGYKPPSAEQVQAARKGQGERGCDYLAIVPDDLVGTVKPLLDRKSKRKSEPLVVKVATFKDLGIAKETEAEDRRVAIRGRIEAEYRLKPRPSYVLLVGGAEVIPPYYKTLHPSYNNEVWIATDLFYSTLEGDDLQADLALGRLPADTDDELKTMVAKILKYEDEIDNHKGGAWGGVVVAAEYENEDMVVGEIHKTSTGRWFHQTAYNVGKFLEKKKGFDAVHQVYVAEDPDLKRPWYNRNGTEIPSDVLGHFTSRQKANEFIHNSWPETVRLVLHRDHGSRLGWYLPRFQVDDVEKLKSAKLAPAVFSLNCETGWFDHDSNQSLAQALMRSPDGGCTVIAASRITWSGTNDRLAEGLIKAVWPDFEFDFELADVVAGKRIGPALNFGRMHLLKSYPESEQARMTVELFNLFGDPEMKITGDRERTYAVAGDEAAAKAGVPVRIGFPSSFARD
jgi:hypothetical protein